ncbi:MAG TPA: AmmeMemoRadiSam system protein B [Thermoanaerobaculia bacterium]|nr:AmmeMemoRadiSam system protein B [Thermoanaerobaculia bacterium]
MVEGLLREAPASPVSRTSDTPKAIIAPHAGYVYSGPIAASAFQTVAPSAGRIERVVVLGPSHFVPFRGLALPGESRFETPLGEIAVSPEAAQASIKLPQVRVQPDAHTREHSIEVELPFLQVLLGEDFKILPLAVGDASAEEVAEVLDRVWGGPETLIVISSDLSHFHSYEEARAIDQATAQRILELDGTLDGYEACGARPVNGLLMLARQRGLVPELLDLRNSGDTAGDRSRVVGYGAFAFREAA